jgi:hypothetical protein
MKNLKFGDFVWWNKEGWQYVGMDEDGALMLSRPVRGHPFHIIEVDLVYCDEFGAFEEENGYYEEVPPKNIADKVKALIEQLGSNMGDNLC